MGIILSIFYTCYKLEDDNEVTKLNDVMIPTLKNHRNSNEKKKIKWSDEQYHNTMRKAYNLRNKYKKSNSW